MKSFTLWRGWRMEWPMFLACFLLAGIAQWPLDSQGGSTTWAMFLKMVMGFMAFRLGGKYEQLRQKETPGTTVAS